MGQDLMLKCTAFQHFCVEHGGHLVHVDNADENAFLKNSLRSGKGENHWMGLTDERVEGIWIWFDTQMKPNFTDWHPGQPDDGGHHEDCGHFYPNWDFQWNDAPCNNKYEPLCEIRGGDAEIIG